IRCPSVTPTDAGVLDVLAGALTPLGFTCRRLRFSEPGTPDIDNLVAHIGSGSRHFGFAGHVDVVPPGEGWSIPPFAAEVRDERLYGRGAADMKTAVAAFAAAVSAFLAERGAAFDGRISLIVTGDEEGPAINGTRKMLASLKAENALPEVCLLGEPTCPDTFGEAIKIGRRGSLTAYLTVVGVQGHVAYPERADNPILRLVHILDEVTSKHLDAGNAHFPPSSLSVTTVDVGNAATNVIPAEAKATLNIRFNTQQTSESLMRWIKSVVERHAPTASVVFECSAEPFLTPPGPLSDLVAAAVADVTGIVPAFSTSGGTSDARFIKEYCPVVEFGLVGKTMHKADEHVALTDIAALVAVYHRVLERFFAS
ncbi:MAG: succinyl-diaminopimelate desuccinylase, partial [Rhodospirillaceae bacterium]|nr:succinyl-diaminopimelate desuccinylase [Rhodospirillaceae bacterium]